MNGRLVDWNDDRGFGFIEGDDRQRYFVHIKSIARIATRPRIGDRMQFEPGIGRNGKIAAVKVRIAAANPRRPRQSVIVVCRTLGRNGRRYGYFWLLPC